MTNLGDSQLVYNGELEGTTQEIEYASRTAQPGQTYHIYSDTQAGLLRLRTISDHPGQACQIRAIQAAEKAQSTELQYLSIGFRGIQRCTETSWLTP
jgi:hypothetical protein